MTDGERLAQALADEPGYVGDLALAALREANPLVAIYPSRQAVEVMLAGLANLRSGEMHVVPYESPEDAAFRGLARADAVAS